MPTLIDLGRGAASIAETTTHRVYLREHWADAWEETPYLRAIEVVWSTAPSLPVATLEWIYGEIKQADDRDFLVELKLAGKTRSFVKIEIDIGRDPEEPKTRAS